MAQEVIIQLFGSLRRYQREHSSTIVFPCSEPLSLAKLLLAISAERDKVQVVFANGRPVRDDYLVMPGDRISVFPKEYPIFADWKDFRKKSFSSIRPLSPRQRKGENQNLGGGSCHWENSNGRLF